MGKQIASGLASILSFAWSGSHVSAAALLRYTILPTLVLVPVACFEARSENDSVPSLADRPQGTAGLQIPGAKERYETTRRLIAQRLDTVLLPAMREHSIDLWLVLSRQHNEDPMLAEIGGGWGGVRNAYLFFDTGGDQPEKIFIGSHYLRDHTISETYDELIYYGYSEEGIRPFLKKVIDDRDPKRIGINVSPTLEAADGLTWTLRNFLEETLGPKYSARMVSAELLIRDFRTNHLPEEWSVFQDVCHWTAIWEEEALSDAVVTVGVTTAADIEWWMREKALDLGLGQEFIPGVRLVREGEPLPMNSPDHPVQPGDLINVDAGFSYTIFRTDYKRTAYVLRPGETEPPASLQRAFADAVRATDRLTANMIPGAIGHEVWQKTVSEFEAQGYVVDLPITGAAAGQPTAVATGKEIGIYSHSVGNSTLDLGARIAVDYPFAYGDRVRYPVAANAWYAIELHVSTPIPEWSGRVIQMRIEENARVTDSGVEYCTPRQEKLLVITGTG